MHKNLVIVESPAKAKTIEKFLGKEYKVLSSYGHIRDLKKSSFSIDIENNFEPIYEVPADKKKLVNELKAEAKKAEIVWLASDEDREGEAIAWHLFEELGLTPEKTKRIVFHEITKGAILKAIENPRDIDQHLVDAQQARRVLDRMVGFELSPVLWKKVKPSLSAGRVQSVAVRLIVEREREIQRFDSEPFYRVTASFLTQSSGKETEIKAEVAKRLKTKQEAMTLLESCKLATFTIEDIVTKPAKKSPSPPFTTSTLQQEAARKLGYSVGQTMMLAQKLYEAGKITYMRTDSVNLSDLALGTTKQAIIEKMGEQYVKTRTFTTKSKGAQEAHEAIRPTYMSEDKAGETAQEKKLYELIWKRTIASQMADAELEKTAATITLDTTSEKFVATGEVLKFDGFLRVYRESYDDEMESEDETGLLPPLTKGEVLARKEIVAMERFTQRPARYAEASLVRKLEELGIGRPSTYAPTISTIQQRTYVVKEDREGEQRNYDVLTLIAQQIKEEHKTELTGAEKSKLFPTDVGLVVNDFLTQYFPNVLDFNFTAQVEKQFDEVADGERAWKTMMEQFYTTFHQTVEEALAVQTERRVGNRLLGIDPASGKEVCVKIGRFGPVAQIGSAEDEEKPRFGQLKKGQSLDTLTLEEALELFKLPRKIGMFEEFEVTIGVGRFGPYIYHHAKYTSLPKTVDPMEISLEEAIELIEEKRIVEANKRIKTFEEKPEIEILNGRFGPYITCEKVNYKIPKTLVAADLTLDQCLEIIKEQDAKPPTSSAKRAAAAKVVAAKKSATPKKTVKKRAPKATTKKKKAD